MRIIDLEQGTKEWLSWRKTVITATDCPAILGSSPWVTPFKCWQKKLGLMPEQKGNNAMERGKRLEPIIRDRFIKKFGMNMTPLVVESSEYEFLGASLDGISDCKKYILEIKTGGQDLYRMAMQGFLPLYYLDQIQHQLLVTGAKKCFYQVGSEDEEKDIVIEVLPDPTFKNRFLPKARSFWKGVAFFESPPLTDSDYKIRDDNLDWKEYTNICKEIDVQLKTLQDKKDYVRKKLIELCDDQSSMGNGVKVIQDLDLDKYRKNSTTVWKIIIDSNS